MSPLHVLRALFLQCNGPIRPLIEKFRPITVLLNNVGIAKQGWENDSDVIFLPFHLYKICSTVVDDTLKCTDFPDININCYFITRPGYIIC